ncbi:MAG TPA: hypothetical protein VN641_20725 [Urbifossiella sp.]|nr:hypothetical protein [Urbifossiella sp.]
MSIDAIVKQIEALPERQREELLDQLDTIYGDQIDPAALSPGMKFLIEERDARYEADPTNVVTWDQLLASLRRAQ